MTGRRMRQFRYVGTCPWSGKLQFETRRNVRKAIRTWNLHDGNPNAYRCEDCGYWHIGRLPSDIVNGRFSRSVLPEWTRRRRAIP